MKKTGDSLNGKSFILWKIPWSKTRPRHQVPLLQLLHQFTGSQSRVGVLGEHHVRLIQGASNCRQPSRCQDGSGGGWYESWPVSILHYISWKLKLNENNWWSLCGRLPLVPSSWGCGDSIGVLVFGKPHEFMIHEAKEIPGHQLQIVPLMSATNSSVSSFASDATDFEAHRVQN